MSGTVRETKFRMQGVKQGHSSKQWHHEAVTYIKVCTYLLQDSHLITASNANCERVVFCLLTDNRLHAC